MRRRRFRRGDPRDGIDLLGARIMDMRTLREFDELCRTLVRPMAAKDIRAVRARERVSQAVFARYLNVTPGLVRLPMFACP